MIVCDEVSDHFNDEKYDVLKSRLDTREHISRLKNRIRMKYPHRCPCCGGAAYVGFEAIDCLSKCNK